MSFNITSNMYRCSYDITSKFTPTISLNTTGNKLLCTFTPLEELDTLISHLTNTYDIMYDKIFVLHIKSNNEYVCTYNIDPGNINTIPNNTILVHRKKEHNVLYTINALNEVIKKLNGGVVDLYYKVNWQHYQNSILLTQNNEVKQLNTKIFKIVNIYN